jgi:hypothetical protein
MVGIYGLPFLDNYEDFLKVYEKFELVEIKKKKARFFFSVGD